jgi:type II restriction enzyme
MNIAAEQLFQKLTQEYQLVGQSGEIQFRLKDLSMAIESKDSVGNLVQEWLKAWMRQEQLTFEESSNTQAFPDIFLNVKERARNNIPILAAFFSALLRYSSVT